MKEDNIFEWLKIAHSSWHAILTSACQKLPQDYIHSLAKDHSWLPGRQAIFNAFRLPLEQVHYILMGESPYPRFVSANGYAFWDNAVTELWSESGLSKSVNRATSLRNILKMLLLAEGKLSSEKLSQENIAKLNKTHCVKTIHELFHNLLNKGFLLLNANLVLSHRPVSEENQYWLPFLDSVLSQIKLVNPNVILLLFGKIAERVTKLPIAKDYTLVVAEHPYNLSFIQNEKLLNFFAKFHLLEKSHN